MATIKKRGDYQWRARIEKKNAATGQVHCESKTFLTKEEAESWSRVVEEALARGKYNDTKQADETQLSELIERYIKEVSPSKLGAAQEITRLKAWKKNPLAVRFLTKITPKDFADYIAARRKDISRRGGKVSEQTIKHEIICISNVFEVARKDWGFDIPNPIKQISKPKGSQARDVRILPDDWLKIADELRKCRNDLYIVIAEFAIETGMRQDEIFRMTWADIDHVKKTVLVYGKDTANAGQRKPRTVPLSTRVMELIATLPRHIDGTQPVFNSVRTTSADGLSRAFTAACAEIGLTGGCFHSTRHEAASRMAPHYPMLTLMSIFGWKTPSMAARYYHATTDELHAGLERMQAARS
jgi:integrase